MSITAKTAPEDPIGTRNPLSAAEGEIAGRLYTRLKSRGITIGNQDLLIAATVLALGLTLLTRNVDHFGAIEGLKIAAVASLK
jgi:predicted nucleic acid-binding protein